MLQEKSSRKLFDFELADLCLARLIGAKYWSYATRPDWYFLRTEKALQKTPLSETLLKPLLWSQFKLHWCCAQSSHRLWVEHKTLGIIALSADISQFPSSTMIFGNWSQIKQRYSNLKLMLEGTKASNSKSYTLLSLSPPLHITDLNIHISLRRYLLRKRERFTYTARCTNTTDRSQVFGRCNN